MVWLDLDREMARHLRCSVDYMQYLTEEEYLERMFESCQDLVRSVEKDKKERRRLLRENRKYYRKSRRALAKQRAREALAVVVAPYDLNNNEEEGEKVVVEEVEERDWDDERWEELSLWIS